MFAGISKLPPASCAVFENGSLKIRRYWKTVFPPETDPRGDEELARELWQRVKDATEARLVGKMAVQYSADEKNVEGSVAMKRAEGGDWHQRS